MTTEVVGNTSDNFAEEDYLKLESQAQAVKTSPASGVSELGNDPFQTPEQEARDKHISDILRLYREAYDAKIHQTKRYRSWLFYGCISLTYLLVAACVASVIKWVFFTTVSIESIASLAAVCATLIGSIAVILQTIVRYTFPEKEEENITEIIKTIQSSDLENKKLNISARTSSKEKAQC